MGGASNPYSQSSSFMRRATARSASVVPVGRNGVASHCCRRADSTSRSAWKRRAASSPAAGDTAEPTGSASSTPASASQAWAAFGRNTLREKYGHRNSAAGTDSAQAIPNPASRYGMVSMSPGTVTGSTYMSSIADVIATT